MRQIAIEEVSLKALECSFDNVPIAYRVIVDGKRSPLFFSRRDASDAVDRLLEAEGSNRPTTKPVVDLTAST